MRCRNAPTDPRNYPLMECRVGDLENILGNFLQCLMRFKFSIDVYWIILILLSMWTVILRGF